MKNCFNVDTFEEEIKNFGVPVIVDFYATWCNPCKMLSPVLEKVQEKFEGALKVIKIDIDENRDITAKYDIMSVPTLMFFSGGELVRRESGFIPENELLEMIYKDFCIIKNELSMILIKSVPSKSMYFVSEAIAFMHSSFLLKKYFIIGLSKSLNSFSL